MRDFARDKFDLLVVRAARDLEGLPPDLPFDQHLLLKEGTKILLDVSLQTATAIMRSISAAHARYSVKSAGTYIVPTAYRTAKIDQVNARIIALDHWKMLCDQGRPLDEPGSGLSEPMWWEFFSSDRDAQAQELIPGGIFIPVDKIDGHVYSTAEAQAFYDIQLTE
jgi:hypothetical protein